MELDEEKIRKGKEIRGELLLVINNSKMSAVVSDGWKWNLERPKLKFPEESGRSVSQLKPAHAALPKMQRKRDSSPDPAASGDDGDPPPGAEFEVFLNFRGPDTRLSFTDCLYHAMDGAGVRVFRDEEEIRKGEEIGGELLRAINNSEEALVEVARIKGWDLKGKGEGAVIKHIVDEVVVPKVSYGGHTQKKGSRRNSNAQT
ncbi:hypothetical protein NL676_026741 [Syzygium grande]|nr:hypothetical protein NL676_026741 [Syzygium grande]